MSSTFRVAGGSHDGQGRARATLIKEIVDLMNESGIAGMRFSISETAKYGDIKVGQQLSSKSPSAPASARASTGSDPALSTLNGHYEPQPVECRVLDSRHVIGNSNTNCLLDIRLLSTNSHFMHYLYYETRDSPYYIIKLIRQLLCQKHLRQSQLLQKILQA